MTYFTKTEKDVQDAVQAERDSNNKEFLEFKQNTSETIEKMTYVIGLMEKSIENHHDIIQNLHYRDEVLTVEADKNRAELKSMESSVDRILTIVEDLTATVGKQQDVIEKLQNREKALSQEVLNFRARLEEDKSYGLGPS